nr:MAG TPA: hypothetical protein [Caudoviricetes sp.]
MVGFVNLSQNIRLDYPLYKCGSTMVLTNKTFFYFYKGG